MDKKNGANSNGANNGQQHHIATNAFEKRKPVFSPTGKVEDINPEETLIVDVRRHFFGLFLIYLETILAISLSLGLLIFLLPGFFGKSAALTASLSFLSLILMMLGFIFIIIATKIYTANQLIVTDIHITQVIQVGIFNRKVSELTMENVEDVTSNQAGIFPTLFNYGTITIETAGEQNNFIFKFCPNPNAYAKAIQDARAEYQRHLMGHKG